MQSVLIVVNQVFTVEFVLKKAYLSTFKNSYNGFSLIKQKQSNVFYRVENGFNLI